MSDHGAPPLHFRDLTRGRRFGPSTFPTSPELVAIYAGITGDDDPIHRDPDAARAAGFGSPTVPPGLLGVLARQAYLPDHRMLPGGVMAGQRFELRGSAPVGTTLQLTAEVVEIDPSDPRRRVVIRAAVTGPEGPVAVVSIDARWPSDETSADRPAEDPR